MAAPADELVLLGWGPEGTSRHSLAELTVLGEARGVLLLDWCPRRRPGAATTTFLGLQAGRLYATGRALWALPRSVRVAAERSGSTVDGWDVFVLPREAPAAIASSFGAGPLPADAADAILVRQIAAVDVLLGGEDLHPRLAGQIKRGLLPRLPELLRASAFELAGTRRLGTLSRQRFECWIESSTAQHGCPLTAGQVRQVLLHPVAAVPVAPGGNCEHGLPEGHDRSGAARELSGVRSAPPVSSEARSVVRRLLELDPWRTDLPVRLRNWLQRGRLPGLRDLLSMSEQELAWSSNIGAKTRHALEAWVQRQTALLGCRLTGEQVRELLAPPDLSSAASDARRGSSSDEPHAPSDAEARRLAELLQWPPQPALRMLRELEPGLAGVPIQELGVLPARVQKWIERQAITTLRDLTTALGKGAWRVRNLGMESLDALADAVRALCERIAAAPSHVSVEAALRHEVLRQPLAEHVANVAGTLSERYRSILWRRILRDPPETLGELGDGFGITRERVRQLEGKVLRRLDARGNLRTLVDSRLRGTRRALAQPLWISDLAELDPWFAGSESWLAPLLVALDAKHRVAADGGRQLVTAVAGADLEALVRSACTHLDRLFSGADAAGGAGVPTPHRDAHDEADAGDAAAATALRAFLDQEGVSELWPLVVARGVLVRSRRGFGRRATAAERVEAVLASEPRAFRIAELQAALPDLPPRRVGAALREIDVVHPVHGLHLLRAHLRGYDVMLPSVREDVVELMRCEPSRQWRVATLHAALHEAGASWTDRVPPHVLDHLVRQIDEVRYLSRGVFGLASEHSQRLAIAGVGERILTDHGAPMPIDDLVEAIRVERDIGVVVGLSYPLAWLGPNLVGLATRDLGIDRRAWDKLGREVRAAARRGEEVDDAFLLAALARVRRGGPPVAADVLRRLVAPTLAGARRTSSARPMGRDARASRRSGTRSRRADFRVEAGAADLGGGRARPMLFDGAMERPDDLIPTGSTPDFDAEALPDALRTRHATAPGNWGVLHVLAGEVTWFGLDDGSEVHLSAGAEHLIRPEVPHRIEPSADARVRIDFFRERA